MRNSVKFKSFLFINSIIIGITHLTFAIPNQNEILGLLKNKNLQSKVKALPEQLVISLKNQNIDVDSAIKKIGVENIILMTNKLG